MTAVKKPCPICPRKWFCKKDNVREERPLQVGTLLKSIYTDLRNPASFSSPYGLFKAAKKINPNITSRDVEFWLEAQPVYTLYRKSKNTSKGIKLSISG